MADLLAYLPPLDGLLPRWLFLVSATSAANSFQAYRSETYASQLYNVQTADGRSAVNALSARTFGTWTLLSAVIRMYAAYNISTPIAYDLAAWSFGIALLHFMAEWLVFGTAQPRGRFVGPLAVASTTIVWMLTQRDAYLA